MRQSPDARAIAQPLATALDEPYMQARPEKASTAWRR
jgi:hypothetical protein